MSIGRVGRYDVLREVGRGGMAVVYLARQVDLQREVALKELGAFHAADPGIVERFVRESRVAGALTHPNIVTVHDFFEHQQTPYIAMEYVPHGSLRPHIGHMTLAQIAGICEGLLAALTHAEAHEVVHRDLKPENLMITPDGRIKVADFGIAKATALAGTGEFMTATGTTVGTPSYMAPEQAMARDIGPWTDLYSVGVMTYEMLLGRTPFWDTESAVALMLRHVNDEPPPLLSVNPDLDADLAAWVERLLVKDVTARTRSATQAWDELETVLIDLLGPRWRRDARLPTQPGGQTDAHPLTPAPFHEPSRVHVATPPPLPTFELERSATAASPAAADDGDGDGSGFLTVAGDAAPGATDAKHTPPPSPVAAATPDEVPRVEPPEPPEAAPPAPPVATQPPLPTPPPGPGNGAPAAPAGDRDPKPAGGRRPPTWLLAAAGGAIVAVGAMALLLGGGGDDKEKTARPAATVGAAPETLTGGPPKVGEEWRPLRRAPLARQQGASAALAGRVYLVGGLTGLGTATEATKSVEAYDPAINTWVQTPDLPVALHHLSAVAYRGELVVLGGWIPQGQNLTATVSDRVFALRGGRWARLPRLRHARTAAAAAVIDGRIVVVGGQNEGKLVPHTEVFDGKRWRDAAPMPTPREHVAAAASRRYMYVVGGRKLGADKNVAALERYDARNDTWKKLADMPTPSGSLGAAVVNGQFVAVGGESPSEIIADVQDYNLATQTWSSLAPLRTPRHGLAVAAIGHTLYAIGGARDPGHAASSNAADALDFGG